MTSFAPIIKNYLLPPAVYSLVLQSYDALVSLYRFPHLFSNSQLKRLRRTEECIIIGNGPSLLREDFNRIALYDCFVANEFYAVKNSELITPLVYTAADPVPASISKENYTHLLPDFDRMTKSSETNFVFHLSTYRAIKSGKLPFKYPENIYGFIGKTSSNNVASDFTKGIGPARFTPMVNTLLAIYMGYKSIYLIGCDQDSYFNFFCSNKQVVDHAYTTTSVRPYETTNYNWRSASLACYKTYNCWHHIKAYAESLGISIYDSTIGGRLDVFKKSSIYDAIHS